MDVRRRVKCGREFPRKVVAPSASPMSLPIWQTGGSLGYAGDIPGKSYFSAYFQQKMCQKRIIKMLSRLDRYVFMYPSFAHFLYLKVHTAIQVLQIIPQIR